MTQGQIMTMLERIARINLVLDPPNEEHMTPADRAKLDLIRRGAKFRG